MALIKKWRKF